jgi:hypothetical protein
MPGADPPRHSGRDSRDKMSRFAGAPILRSPTVAQVVNRLTGQPAGNQSGRHLRPGNHAGKLHPLPHPQPRWHFHLSGKIDRRATWRGTSVHGAARHPWDHRHIPQTYEGSERKRDPRPLRLRSASREFTAHRGILSPQYRALVQSTAEGATAGTRSAKVVFQGCDVVTPREARSVTLKKTTFADRVPAVAPSAVLCTRHDDRASSCISNPRKKYRIEKELSPLHGD